MQIVCWRCKIIHCLWLKRN